MDAAAAEGDAARFPEDEEYTERPQNTLPFPSISRQGSVEIDINEKKIYGPPVPPGATYAPAQGACTPFARGYAPRPRPLPYFCSAQNTAPLVTFCNLPNKKTSFTRKNKKQA